MHAPGVEVRPLVQITGNAEFNEVFFTDVRVPDSARIGPVGEGWRVAITTLMNERVSLSGAGSVAGDAIGGSSIRRLIARHHPVSEPLFRQRLAAAYIDNELIGLNNRRAADRRRDGAEAGPEGSITKLQQALFNQRLQKLAIDLEGPAGVAWEGEGLEADGTIGWIPSRSRTRTIARLSSARRRTPSRAVPLTSCATSSANGCWVCRRSLMRRVTCRGRTYPAPPEWSLLFGSGAVRCSAGCGRATCCAGDTRPRRGRYRRLLVYAVCSVLSKVITRESTIRCARSSAPS